MGRTLAMDGIVVVSGGGTGIGKAVAGAFARGGRRVVIVGRRGGVLRAASEELGGGVVPLVADVAEVDDVERVAAAIRALPAASVDVLVNNAGGLASTGDGDGLAGVARDWEAEFRANMLSAVLLTTALDDLLTSPGGRVVNLSSGAAYRNSDVATAYNVGKGALARITAAVGLGPDPAVPTFDLAPGVVRTDMTLSMKAHEGRTEWTSPEEVTDLLLGLASGALDAWSGRLVRAGIDTVASLRARAELGLGETDRTLGLLRWGEDDPLT